MQNLKVAAIQTSLHWENPDVNLEMMRQKVSDVQGADIILLPEMFTTGFSMNTNLAEPDNGQGQQFLREMAISKNAAVGGSVMVAADGKCFNRFYFCMPDGTCSFYDKRHLFRMADENQFYSSGNARVVVEYKGVRLFLLVCYDLRFPVWSRNNLNYDAILLVANWPQARIAAWEKLIAARAIENQCFVAAVNRVGLDGKNIPYNGSSRFVDFRGETISESYDSETTLIASFNIEELQLFRKQFPASLDADTFEIKF